MCGWWRLRFPSYVSTPPVSKRSSTAEKKKKKAQQFQKHVPVPVIQAASDIC